MRSLSWRKTAVYMTAACIAANTAVFCGSVHAAPLTMTSSKKSEQVTGTPAVATPQGEPTKTSFPMSADTAVPAPEGPGTKTMNPVGVTEWWSTDPGVAGGATNQPALPQFVVGGYWKKWGESNPYTLGSTDPRYNVVFLSFGLGQSDGSLKFNQTVQTEASFIEDVKKLQARGTRVIMSIGGEHSLINLKTDAAVQNFLQSVRGYRAKYGINGIDWDIEGQAIHIGNMEKISRQLKQEFGDSFAVTLTPQGHIYEYKDLAKNLGSKFDMISIMYYDYLEATPEARTRAVIHRSKELVEKYGVQNTQLGVGMRVTDTNGKYYENNNVVGFSLYGADHTMKAMQAAFPGYRGVFNWTIDYDRRAGKKWLAAVESNQPAGSGGDGAPVVPEPTPTPDPKPTPKPTPTPDPKPTPTPDPGTGGPKAPNSVELDEELRKIDKLFDYFTEMYQVVRKYQDELK